MSRCPASSQSFLLKAQKGAKGPFCHWKGLKSMSLRPYRPFDGWSKMEKGKPLSGVSPGGPLWIPGMKLLPISSFHPGLFKPYSLRRGGATSAYKNGCPLDTLVSKGRWQHLHTARIYLDTGLQALTSLTLPTASHPCLQAAIRFFLSVSQQGARGR